MQGDVAVQADESDEVRALRRLAAAAGWCVTATTNGTHAENSFHKTKATNGRGRAVDLAARSGAGWDTGELLRINEQILQLLPLSMIVELIYAGVGAICVKNGRMVDCRTVFGPVVLAAHHNHVHLAVVAGFTYIPAPDPAPPTQAVTPMYDPPLGPICAAWLDNQGRVISAVSPKGEVFWGKWWGNVAGKPYWADRVAAGICGRPDGQAGYRITATDGATYDLPDGIDRL